MPGGSVAHGETKRYHTADKVRPFRETHLPHQTLDPGSPRGQLECWTQPDQRSVPKQPSKGEDAGFLVQPPLAFPARQAEPDGVYPHQAIAGDARHDQGYEPGQADNENQRVTIGPRNRHSQSGNGRRR